MSISSYKPILLYKFIISTAFSGVFAKSLVNRPGPILYAAIMQSIRDSLLFTLQKYRLSRRCKYVAP